MKSFLHLFSFCCLILVAGEARATTTPHYGVTFSATIYSSVSTGMETATLKTTKFNNAKLFGALISSGSVTGVEASDMDIVIGAGTDLTVINKTTHALLYTLSATGTESMPVGEVAWGNLATKIGVIGATLNDILMPGYDTFSTYGLVRATAGPDYMPIKAFVLTLQGYNGTDIIEVVIRKNGRVYNY